MRRPLQVLALLIATLTSLARADRLVAAADAETARPARDAAGRFVRAMLANDLAAVRAASVEGPEQRGLVELETEELVAFDAFDRAVERRFGRLPTDSFRAMLLKLPAAPVYIGKAKDAAFVEFLGGFPLRRVGGEWKVDVAELDYENALRERSDLTKDIAATLRTTAAAVPVAKMKHAFDAPAVKANALAGCHARHPQVTETVKRAKAERNRAGCQGRWSAELTRDAPDGAAPAAPVKVVLTIRETTLKLEGAADVAGAGGQLDPSDGALLTPDAESEKTGRHWILCHHRGPAVLVGALIVTRPDGSLEQLELRGVPAE